MAICARHGDKKERRSKFEQTRRSISGLFGLGSRPVTEIVGGRVPSREACVTARRWRRRRYGGGCKNGLGGKRQKARCEVRGAGRLIPPCICVFETVRVYFGRICPISLMKKLRLAPQSAHKSPITPTNRRRACPIPSTAAPSNAPAKPSKAQQKLSNQRFERIGAHAVGSKGDGNDMRERNGIFFILKIANIYHENIIFNCRQRWQRGPAGGL